MSRVRELKTFDIIVHGDAWVLRDYYENVDPSVDTCGDCVETDQAVVIINELEQSLKADRENHQKTLDACHRQLRDARRLVGLAQESCKESRADDLREALAAPTEAFTPVELHDAKADDLRKAILDLRENELSMAAYQYVECDGCRGEVILPSQVDSATIIPMLCPACAIKVVKERDEARRELVKACIDNPREQPSEYHRQCVETADAWWPGSGEVLFP